jgi:hypothetical protein
MATRENEDKRVQVAQNIGIIDFGKTEKVKHTSPAEKARAEITRKVIGECAIHIETHQGTRGLGERL